MDWSKITRNKVATGKPYGAYASLDELVRIQFKARDFSFLPQQPVSSILSGRYASRLRGRGLNFEELRRYQPGDDTRTIDWKVTARTRSPHVRVYSEEKDRAVILVIDQRINMFFGTRDKFKSVTAAELAALAAWRSVDMGDRVGAVVFNDTEVIDIQPQRSQKTVMAILGAVVRLNHQLRADSTEKPNPDMLNIALQKALRLASHDMLMVLISDFFGVDEHTERLTTQMAAHNDVLALLVHDPMRLDPGQQPVNVSDGSMQMQLNLSNKKERDSLIQDYKTEQQQISHFLRKVSAPLLMVSNQGDVVDQVRHLLGVPRRV
ncbi:MAG: DUF58 domain-containing protein [Gammaproteobacteria bacterium]